MDGALTYFAHGPSSICETCAVRAQCPLFFGGCSVTIGGGLRLCGDFRLGGEIPEPPEATRVALMSGLVETVEVEV